MLLSDHLGYLADEARNVAYASAMVGQGIAGKTVLDLGCGTGVLGMLALHAGAKSVIAADHDAAILADAKAIATAAGFADRISYVNETITRDHAVWDEVDVCVHEMVGNFVLEEKAGYVLNGTVTPLIPYGFGFKIDLVDFNYCDLKPLVGAKTAAAFADYSRRTLAPKPVIAHVGVDDPRYVNVVQSYSSRAPFAFNDVIDAYTFRFEIKKHYDWLAIRVSGLLQFEKEVPLFYAMAHSPPCAWSAVTYLNTQLTNVEPGKVLIVTIAAHGIAVELR